MKKFAANTVNAANIDFYYTKFALIMLTYSFTKNTDNDCGKFLKAQNTRIDFIKIYAAKIKREKTIFAGSMSEITFFQRFSSEKSFLDILKMSFFVFAADFFCKIVTFDKWIFYYMEKN